MLAGALRDVVPRLGLLVQQPGLSAGDPRRRRDELLLRGGRGGRLRLDPGLGPILWDIKCPVTCWGWDCSASDEGLYCPPGNPGSTGVDGAGYCCRGESWVAGPCPNDCVDKGPQSWAAGDCDGPPYDPARIDVFELQGDDENCLTPIPITAGFYLYVGVDILEDSAVVGFGDVVPDGASPASRPV